MKRVLKALLVHLLVGGAVWWVVDPVRSVLLLPALFTSATRGLVVALLPVTVAVAWRYPSLGGSAGGGGDGGPEASAEDARDAPQ